VINTCISCKVCTVYIHNCSVLKTAVYSVSAPLHDELLSMHVLILVTSQLRESKAGQGEHHTLGAHPGVHQTIPGRT
jgi:hypothetical protein